MSLQDQYHHSRIPLKPLPYRNRELAQNSEFLIDYVGDVDKEPTYHLYIVDPHDVTKIIDITNIMIKEAFGNDITINIEGLDEPLSLHDLLNFIYKRFLYPENLLGFDYARDLDKLFSPDTRMVLMRNTDDIYFVPVTTADAVFDKNGVNIQERLDNMVRLGFANDYIKVAQEDQNVFEITYPFPNYPDNGNYLELRVGTVYVDKSRYSLVDNRDENGDIIGATITFFNEKFEIGRRIDILYIYNAIGIADGAKAAIYGGQIANNSISLNKLEKTSDSYTLNDCTSAATSAAVYSLYKDFSDAINANSGSAYFVVDNSSLPTEIRVELVSNNVTLDGRFIMLNILTTNVKDENFILTVTHANSSFIQYPINMPGGVPANRIIKILVNVGVAKPLTLTESMLTTTRYIHTCRDDERDISYNMLGYEVGSVIRVYRNGVRLFEDLDYSINRQTEIITLFTRTEEGERIVFEAMTC
jgi:hypothetical protein